MTEIRSGIVCSDGNIGRKGALSEERVVDDRMKGRAHLGILSENQLNELFGLRRHLAVRRELIVIVADTPDSKSAEAKRYVGFTYL